MSHMQRSSLSSYKILLLFPLAKESLFQNSFNFPFRHVMSPGPHPAQDSSPYEGKQGLVILNKSSRSVPTVRDHLTRLLTALLLSKGQDHCRKGECCLSLYQNLRRTHAHSNNPIVQSNPYPRGQGNPLHR